jgi:hypothetical protein
MRLRTHLVIPTIPTIPLARRQFTHPCTCPTCRRTVTTTTREPSITVLRPRWPRLIVVATIAVTVLANLCLAPPLYAHLGISLWITVPVITFMGLCVGWYRTQTIEIPLEEP